MSVVKQVSERKNTRAKTRTRSVKSEEGSLQFNDKAKKLGEASELQSQAVPSLLKRSLDQAKINLSSNNETKLKNDRPLGVSMLKFYYNSLCSTQMSVRMNSL